MLQRFSAAACRCASTSTAQPCRHSLPYRAHKSTSPASAAAAPAAPEVDRPFDYTAPLWGSRPPTEPRWFRTSRVGWRPEWTKWLQANTPPPSTSYSRLDPPDQHPSAPHDQPIGPMMDSGKADAIDDYMAGRLAAYFASRGPRTTLDQFRDEFGEYLSVAEHASMPLVKAMILEDAGVGHLSSRQRKHLGMERFAATTPREETKVQRVIERGKARPALVEVSHEQEPPVRRREGEAKVALPAAVEPVAAEADSGAQEAPLDMPQATALLQQYVSTLPVETIATASNTRLALAWDVFADEADLGESASDLELATSFLHRLVHPATPRDALADTLPIALRVLDSLLDVLPDDIVAPQPTGVDQIPQDVRLQIVLIRTAATVALADNFLPLATRVLQSLARLRAMYPTLSDAPESATDVELLETTMQRVDLRLADERHTTYRVLAGQADVKGPPLIAVSSSLLQLAARWLPSQPIAGAAPAIPASLAQHLATFADETAHRARWDLLAQQWAIWSARGWVLARWHVPLARWLAGEAPYATYPLALGDTHSTRTVRALEFERFAFATCMALRAGTVGREWTLEVRSEWLELLCASPAANKATRRQARHLALLWHKAAPPHSANPFMLRASALLALVRTALPPHTSQGPHERGDEREEATSLVAAHLAALVVRSSLYARTDGKLAHFDLTMLAQAYTLLGDRASAAQVLRRLLDQKILPDRKDVEVVITGQAVADPEKALKLVDAAARFGIRVDYPTLEGVLRAMLEHIAHGRNKNMPPPGDAAAQQVFVLARDDAVARLQKVARSLGATEADCARLRRYAADFLALRPVPGARPPRDDSHVAALEQLRAARAIGDHRAARNVFRRAVRELGTRSERAVLLALDACAAADRSRVQPRAWAREAVREIVEIALAPDGEVEHGVTMIRSREGLEKVLEWMPKVGDVAAVDALMEVMREQGEVLGEKPLSPGEKMERSLVRWAVAQVGREELLAGHGWLAGAAWRVLSMKEKKR